MVAMQYPAGPPGCLPGVRLGGLRPEATARRRPAATPAAVYRRRRLSVAAGFLAALLAGGTAAGTLRGGSLTAPEGGPAAARSVNVRPVSRTTHVVAPGDTLWSIARAARPAGDVRPLVDALVAARGGRPLQVGERLELPPGAY